VFLRKGEVTLTGEKWRVIVEVDVTRWNSQVAMFQERLEGMETYLRAMVGDYPSLAILDADIQRMKGFNQRVSQKVRDLESMMPVGREPRGLINAGGTLLKFLFGNPDADDAEELKRDIRHLETTQGDLVYAMGEQFTLTRRLSEGLDRAGAQVKNLTTLVGIALREVREKGSQVGARLSHLSTQTDNTLKITTPLHILGMNALEFYSQCEDLLKAIEEALAGRFTRGLVPPGELSTILRRVSTGLPEGLALLTDEIAEAVNLYYTVSTLMVTATKTSIMVAIDLPLKTIGATWVWYEVVSRPLWEPVTQRLVSTKREAENFLVDERSRAYSLLSEMDRKRCRGTARIVCPVTGPVYDFTAASCTLDQFLNRSSYEASRCQWALAIRTTLPTWIWDSYTETWYYSLPTPTLVHVMCRRAGGTDSQRGELSGCGRMQLLEGCSLRTPSYRIWPTTEDLNSTWSREISWMSMDPAPKVELPVNGTEEWTALKEVVQQLEGGSSPLGASQTDWMKWETVEELYRERLADKARNRLRIWIPSAGGLALLGLGGLGLLTWVIGRRRRPATQAAATPAVVYYPEPPIGEFCARDQQV